MSPMFAAVQTSDSFFLATKVASAQPVTKEKTPFLALDESGAKTQALSKKKGLKRERIM